MSPVAQFLQRGPVLAKGLQQPTDCGTGLAQFLNGGTPIVAHVLTAIGVEDGEFVECVGCGWTREWFPGHESKPAVCGVLSALQDVERAILTGAREQRHLQRLLVRTARG